MNWNCTQIEERLSDFLDGILSPDEAREIQAHAETCEHCGPMILQVRGMLARIQELEAVEAPAYLNERIITATLGPRKQKKNWFAWLGNLASVFRPQYALAAAGAMLSLAIVVQFALPVRYKKAAFSPGQIVFSANRQVHIVYSHGVKYVNDLRVVYEIQSRLRPEPQPEGPAEPPVESPRSPQQKSEQEPTPGHSANPTRYALAMAVMPASGGDWL